MLFQSTLPRGERHFCYRLVHFRDYFNPRSREGSDPCSAAKGSESAYFNPRSREGSDGMLAQIKGTAKVISIHAPARGATTDGILLSSSNLFQSTLPRGERLSQLTYQRGGFRFQSTLPRGERLAEDALHLPVAEISIHAPARGATAEVDPIDRLKMIHAHAPARGATTAGPHMRPAMRRSTLTLPRGERQ